MRKTEICLQKIMKIHESSLKITQQTRCAFIRFFCYNQYRIVLSTDQTFDPHFDSVQEGMNKMN